MSTAPPATPPATARRFRPALAFIFVTAVLDVMSMGLVIPVLPALIEEFSGSPGRAGVWNGVLVALWAGMQFLCSPVIGSLSDRYGRRPVILLSAVGMTIDWVFMALAPGLGWLAVGRVIGGMTSSNVSAIYAYLADITPAQERSRAYGWLGAASSAGFIAGPALGGVLGQWGPRVPFWVAGALSGLAFLYGLFVLPESLPAERRAAFSWRRANPLGALQLLRSHAELTGLAGVFFLFYFAQHVFSSIYVLYAQHRYGYDVFTVGLLLALAGVLEMGVQGLLVSRIAARLGDRRTLVLGLTVGSGAMAMMGAAPVGGVFIAALVPNALGTLAMPTIQSLMTRRVSEREQGQLQGANNSVTSIAGIASPLFFGWVYSQSAAVLPGLGFFLAALILLVSAGTGVLVARRATRAEA